MRVAIIGSGGVGSATARFLARAGHAVTVWEQFGVDHDRGSSYGQSRVIRRVYPDVFYTTLMERAYRLWRELEREAGETLLLETGGLFFGPAEHAEMRSAAAALREAEVPFEAWDARQTAARVPSLRLEPGEIALSQPDTGILRASRCVRANVRLARGHGAQVYENRPVARFESTSDGVRLALADGQTVTADRLILTAGPWTGAMLAELGLPLRVTRQPYVHFAAAGDGAAFRLGAFPVWIDMARYFYGFPEHDALPGVKIALHQPGEATDPSSARREVDTVDRATLWDYAQWRFSGLTDQITYEKVCLYTNTPDEDFIIDRHPQDARIVVVAGLSGHGFKFTPLLGELAATLATEREPPFDIRRFSLARFD